MGTKRLFIGGLHSDIKEADLRCVFEFVAVNVGFYNQPNPRVDFYSSTKTTITTSAILKK